MKTTLKPIHNMDSLSMATVTRELELRPHTATRIDGRVETFAQDQIFLNGMRIGYVGHKPGEAICLIRPADAETVAEIQKLVEEKRGTPASHVQTAPMIQERDDETEVDDE